MSRAKPTSHRVTLTDIAQVTGVSAATVSRALAGDPRISERTRLRVTHTAEQLGYVPNAAARSLARKQTPILALLIPDMTDPVYGQIATGFEQTATEHDMQVIFSSTENDNDREWKALRAVMTHRPSGVALLGSILDQGEVLRAVAPTPCVFIESENLALAGHKSDVPSGAIRTDDAVGMRAVAEHLAERGYTRVGYASGPDLASNIIRRDGLRAAAKVAGLAMVVLDATSEPWLAPRAMAKSVLRAHVDALVCYDDRLALGLTTELRTLGVRIPEDIGVVGCDDIPFAALAYPQLTTVAQPSMRLGRSGAWMLLECLVTGAVPASVVEPVQLVVRDSTPVRP